MSTSPLFSSKDSAKHKAVEVSSVHEPALSPKMLFGVISVCFGYEPRGWNSTEPPRASQTATPMKKPPMRDARSSEAFLRLAEPDLLVEPY
jgi:hypothetical protein